MKDQEFPIETLVFTIHNNEIRSSKVKKIVIDSNGQAYFLVIDGHFVEKSKREIDKTKEGLFNKLVNRFTARQNK